jgi:hypothetical protein
MRHMHTGVSIQREGKGMVRQAGSSMYVQVHAQVVVGSL